MGGKFQKKNIILISSLSAIFSLVALIILILFWPQKNPFSIAKVTVNSKSTLSDLSQQLYNKKIISRYICKESDPCWYKSNFRFPRKKAKENKRKC